MEKFQYFTKKGLKKIKKDLVILETIERSKLSKIISEARENGDLSENSEYDAAKESQFFLETKILKIKKKISKAKIIDKSKTNKYKVSILSKVIVKNIINKEENEYKIVPNNESNIKNKKLSIDSPISKGLIGKKIGEICKISLPNGNKIMLKIIKIL